MAYKKHLQLRDLGFTLIELMIVIGIIGVMGLVVIGSTSSSRSHTRDNRRIIDLKEIQLGLALYYDVNKSYPVGSSAAALVTPLVVDKYIPEIPVDPSGDSYEYNGSLTTYCLGANLEDTSAIPAENASSICSTTGSANYKVKR